MAELDVSFDAVLAEIERLSAAQPEGFSVEEMAHVTKMHPKTCREKLRKLMAAGKVRFNGKRTTHRIDGERCRVPVYVFLDGNDGENR